MAKLSEKEIGATIVGGYVHIILPDESSETGFTSYRIKLEDYLGTDITTNDPLTGNGTPSSPLVYDNVVLKYVVPADTNGPISLTTDKNGNAFNFVDGDVFEIYVQVKAWAGGDLLNGLGIRPNNITSNVYVRETAISGSIYPHTSTRKTINSKIRIALINNELIYDTINSAITTADAYEATSYRGCTIGANITEITNFNIARLSAGSQIPAGAIILIKKL